MQVSTSEQGCLYSISEAQRILSLSRAQIYRLINSQDIARVKIGSASRITSSSLNAYIERLKLECGEAA